MRKRWERQVRQGLERSRKSLHLILQVKAVLGKLCFSFKHGLRSPGDGEHDILGDGGTEDREVQLGRSCN